MSQHIGKTTVSQVTFTSQPIIKVTHGAMPSDHSLEHPEHDVWWLDAAQTEVDMDGEQQHCLAGTGLCEVQHTQILVGHGLCCPCFFPVILNAHKSEIKQRLFHT